MGKLSQLLSLCERKHHAVTDEFPSQRARNAAIKCFFVFLCRKASEPTVDLLVMKDAMTLLWRPCDIVCVIDALQLWYFSEKVLNTVLSSIESGIYPYIAL